MTDGKTRLLDLSLEELQAFVVDWGQPVYRAAQVWQWLYGGLVESAEQMTNLPKALRGMLDERAFVGVLTPMDQLVSEDGLTSKVLLSTHDQQLFECVLMRYNERNTVCVSTQVGCPLNCAICATGRQGFERDLSSGEIVAQVLHFQRQLLAEGSRVTHVVVMGMGEPMLNYDAVWRAVLNLNDQSGFALGARRFTISTAGVVPGIARLASSGLPVGLAISLHAPSDELRNELVPLNRRYPLKQLMDSVDEYIAGTGRRVTFEYALIKGVNDSMEQAQAVAQLVRGKLCHVNLIPLNPVAGLALDPSPKAQVKRFAQILDRAGVAVTVRLRRGMDIKAGCGQLRGKQVAANN